MNLNLNGNVDRLSFRFGNGGGDGGERRVGEKEEREEEEEKKNGGIFKRKPGKEEKPLVKLLEEST